MLFRSPGGEKQGMYQPYGFSDDNGGLIDSANDIMNVIRGAQGIQPNFVDE